MWFLCDTSESERRYYDSERREKQLASGCVSSCRQVDVESNKDTNNCQGSERGKPAMQAAGEREI